MVKFRVGSVNGCEELCCSRNKYALFTPNRPFLTCIDKTTAKLVISSGQEIWVIGTLKAIVIVSLARAVLSTSLRMSDASTCCFLFHGPRTYGILVKLFC